MPSAPQPEVTEKRIKKRGRSSGRIDLLKQSATAGTATRTETNPKNAAIAPSDALSGPSGAGGAVGSAPSNSAAIISIRCEGITTATPNGEVERPHAGASGATRAQNFAGRARRATTGVSRPAPSVGSTACRVHQGGLGRAKS